MYTDDILLSRLNSFLPMSSISSKRYWLYFILPLPQVPYNLIKTKYLIVTCKPQSFVCSLPPLYVSNVPLELVMSYKYLGVILKSNLSWSPHIHVLGSKARMVMGFIYHTYFKHCMFQTLVKLYVSFVLPYLTYYSAVGDPPPHSSPSSRKIPLFCT